MLLVINEFTHLFNTVLKEGIYPDDWKIAVVTPIPKIATPKTVGDLRPISILPLPGRIFEKIVNLGMNDHLEKSGYLADQQNGFRRNRSTTKTLATLMDAICLAIDEGE